jgi:peptidoglycan/xylan/chitin deacetylase (PgdA/CDA1 family)
MKLCAVSVDLDEIPHYYGIHGLGAAPADRGASAVYERAVPRLRELARSLEIPLTFFVVGSDAQHRPNAVLLRRLALDGHELGNHTFDHLYGLSRLAPATITEQVRRANEAIEAASGQRPRGFRAPGYLMSGAVYRALAEASMAYSSSVFPCPYYYAAKLAKLGALRLRGRRSESIVDSPAVLAAPREPYRVGEPYWRVGSGVLELPIQVTPQLRLPVIGTALSLLGPALSGRIARRLVGLELVNLELHGIDVLDEHDHLHALAPHQFDLRVPLLRKWAALLAVIEELKRAGYSFVTLSDAARQIERKLGPARA